MERKIGEIFECNGEWYQCVENDSCGECSLFTTECRSGTKSNLADKVFGQCSKVRRIDNKHIVFKKLEKVGEPFACRNMSLGRYGVIVQRYKLFTEPILTDYSIFSAYDTINKTILIALNNKEDMEEKKQKLDKLVDDYMACRIQYAEFDKELKALYDKEENKPLLKEFDLEAAKAGKPVCTRDGRKARIICFDAKDTEGDLTIVALIEIREGYESIERYNMKGKYLIKGCNNYDLMMLPEKKCGWMNVYKEQIYDTKEEAIKVKYDGANYIDTIEIFWEE